MVFLLSIGGFCGISILGIRQFLSAFLLPYPIILKNIEAVFFNASCPRFTASDSNFYRHVEVLNFNEEQ